MGTTIGEATPKGNLPALVKDTLSQDLPTIPPPAADPWSSIIKLNWNLAMLPLVAWSAYVKGFQTFDEHRKGYLNE